MLPLITFDVILNKIEKKKILLSKSVHKINVLKKNKSKISEFRNYVKTEFFFVRYRRTYVLNKWDLENCYEENSYIKYLTNKIFEKRCLYIYTINRVLFIMIIFKQICTSQNK